MLDSVLNFFEWFKDIFLSLFALIESAIKGIADLFQALPSVITYLTSSVGYLPPTLVVFAILTITVSVVYLLANRETGG